MHRLSYPGTQAELRLTAASPGLFKGPKIILYTAHYCAVLQLL